MEPEIQRGTETEAGRRVAAAQRGGLHSATSWTSVHFMGLNIQKQCRPLTAECVVCAQRLVMKVFDPS